MLEIEKIAENLFDKIRSRFDKVSVGDENAKATLDPTKARFFNFDFDIEGEDFGNVTISIVDDNNLKVYFDKELDKKMDQEQRHIWYTFLKGLRKFARRNMLSFDVRDIAKSGLNIRDLKHANKDAEVLNKDEVNLSESKLSKPYGTSRSTYQTLENVKIIARHRGRIVDETKPGARSRNIECFYIENSLGERFRLPEGTTFNGARAYARHVKNGGTLHDDFSQHIGKIINEMNSLKLFVRNMRGKQFEDAETNSMVEAAIDHYGSLHSDLFGLRSQRGYAQYKMLWQPEQPLTDDFDIEALKERFVRRVFDERLMDALPIVQRAYEERKNKATEEFEAWANDLISEDDSVEDIDGNVEDSDTPDETLDSLFQENGFEFNYTNGTYWFESKEELERAKDIIAAFDPRMEFPKMGVADPMSDNQYADSTADRKFPTTGLHEENSSKKDKSVVHYMDNAQGSNHCKDCTMFRAPNSCTAVEGVINPNGVCDLFEAKTLESTDPIMMLKQLSGLTK